jgi:hypothetical protein
MTPQNQEIENLVADIRNKLGSFWTLSSLVLMEHDSPEFKNLIKETAQISEKQKSIIINDLNRILNIVNP